MTSLPIKTGSESNPISGKCSRFSTSNWPVSASNVRRVEPPGPERVATAAKE